MAENTILQDLGVIASSITIPDDLAAKAAKLPIIGSLFAEPPVPALAVTGTIPAAVGGAPPVRTFLGFSYTAWAIALVIAATLYWFATRKQS